MKWILLLTFIFGFEFLSADSVFFFGRTNQDYLDKFPNLKDDIRNKSILDCPGGFGNFVKWARTSQSGVAVAVDILYNNSLESLRSIGHQHIRSLAEYSADAIHTILLGEFLIDYARNPEWYVPASLPRLPFNDSQFDVVISSFLVFSYSTIGPMPAQLDEQWHHQSTREMLRVAKEKLIIWPVDYFLQPGLHPFLKSFLKHYPRRSVEYYKAMDPIRPDAGLHTGIIFHLNKHH